MIHLFHINDKQTGFATYKRFNSGNVDKFCNTELIGYFFDGRGDRLMIEINRDDNGNLSQDIISGLFEYNQENGTKTPMYVFTKIEEWENLEPKKMEKVIADMTYQIYESYFNLDIFTKKFSDLTIKIKKNVMKLMFDSNKYFEKNSKDKNYLKFLQKINSLNNAVTEIRENQKLIELNEMIEKEKKEFAVIEKKLKS